MHLQLFIVKQFAVSLLSANHKFDKKIDAKLIELELKSTKSELLHAIRYGASQCGAQSIAINLILRLFLYRFLHMMSS